MTKIITRPIVCKNCGAKQTISEINGVYPILDCKCGEVLFYQHPKHGIVPEGKNVIVFASEEYYQQQKSIISLNKKCYRGRNKKKKEEDDFEEEKFKDDFDGL